MTKTQFNVAVVIPARNEEKFIGNTLESLANQDLVPYRIVVVDDGSTDKTSEIASSFDNVEVLSRENTGSDKYISKHIIQTINLGLSLLTHDNKCNFIMKIDCDHLLPRNYLSTICNRMTQNPKLVVASGIIKNEPFYDMPLGSGRVVKYDFWKTLDLCYPENFRYEAYIMLKAKIMDLEVEIFPDLITETQRKTGSRYENNPQSFYNLGKGYRAMGYIFPIVLFRMIRVMKKNPLGIFYLLKGFFSRDVEFYEQDIRDYVKNSQYKKIKSFDLNTLKKIFNFMIK